MTCVNTVESVQTEKETDSQRREGRSVGRWWVAGDGWDGGRWAGKGRQEAMEAAEVYEGPRRPSRTENGYFVGELLTRSCNGMMNIITWQKESEKDIFIRNEDNQA
jgi:hypothetical protein